MQTIGKYQDHEKAEADRVLCLQAGVHACICGSVKNGYELLAAQGLAERASKIIREEN